MRKNALWILIMITIIVVIIFWSSGGDRMLDELPYYLKKIIGETATVKIGSATIEAEVAKTPAARFKGLSDREYLPPDKGMLFVFQEKGIYAFTMEETELFLDIIWMSDGKIVYIAKELQQSDGVVDPEVFADYVLEVRGQTAANNGWKVGDPVTITFDKE